MLLFIFAALIIAAAIIAAAVPEFVNDVWPVVAILLPFVQARLVSANAAKWLKFVVAILFAVAAGGVTAFGMDWSAGFELSELVERIAAIFGIAYATFKAIDLRLESSTDLGMNEQELAAPDRGLGA